MKPTKLCFFRHGIAIDPADPDVASDPSGQSRYLTGKGSRRTRDAAKGLRRLDPGFDRILTSPWVRAVQTAEIVSDILGLGDPETLPELAGDRTADELIAALAPYSEQQLVLVGHEPLLSATITRLLVADCEFVLKKSGAALVEVTELAHGRGAVLHWLLTPKQLRWIGKS